MTAAQFKKWRASVGLSQSELAKLLGVAANTVARWERDEVPMPPFLELALETIERNRKGKK